MNKKYSAFISVLFCIFIFGFGILQFVMPDREFSQQENRNLAQFPELTLFGKNGNFFTGEFMEDFEDYITDQFPLRDWWINLKASGEKLLGKQENNKVYFGTDGDTLFAQYTRPSAEELKKRIDYVNRLGANLSQLNVPTYFALIPDKSFVWADRLPANAPWVDDGSVIKDAAGLVKSYAMVNVYHIVAHLKLAYLLQCECHLSAARLVALEVVFMETVEYLVVCKEAHLHVVVGKSLVQGFLDGGEGYSS